MGFCDLTQNLRSLLAALIGIAGGLFERVSVLRTILLGDRKTIHLREIDILGNDTRNNRVTSDVKRRDATIQKPLCQRNLA